MSWVAIPSVSAATRRAVDDATWVAMMTAVSDGCRDGPGASAVTGSTVPYSGGGNFRCATIAPMTADTAPAHGASALVVSYCFPPYSDTSAVVAAKRVRERGEPVDVIYNAMDGVCPLDTSLLNLCGDVVQRFAAVPSPTHFSRWADVTAFTQRGMERAVEWEQSRGRPYARLYSRAGYPASHILGAAYAIARPTVAWTAEFSEPLSRDARGRVRWADVTPNALSGNLRQAVAERGFHLPDDNVFDWAEVVPCVLADELQFTTREHLDVVLEKCHDPQLAERVASRARIAPDPVLPDESYQQVGSRDELDGHRRHIGYVGDADLAGDTVMKALGALPESVRDRLTLHVFTTHVDKVRASPQVSALGSSIRVERRLPYFEFLNVCTTMDCLLVGDAVMPPGAGVSPLLPAEISDYLGSGTPVWGIVESGSPLDREPLVYRSPVNHVSAAVQVLAQIARA